MQITLEVPDEIVEGFGAEGLPRALLESFALEGYRSGTLTEEQVRRIWVTQRECRLTAS